MSIQVVKLFEDAQIPRRANPTDSGLDVCMHNIKKVYKNSGGNGEVLVEDDEKLKKLLHSDTSLVLPFGWRALVGTGIKATVGLGYEIQVRPRSGLALKKGLTVLNTPGTIDESYRDEISVILINLSRAEQEIKFGDRIAQLVIQAVCLDEVDVVNELKGNDRKGGFGSTDNA